MVLLLLLLLQQHRSYRSCCSSWINRHLNRFVCAIRTHTHTIGLSFKRIDLNGPKWLTYIASANSQLCKRTCISERNVTGIVQLHNGRRLVFSVSEFEFEHCHSNTHTHTHTFDAHWIGRGERRVLNEHKWVSFFLSAKVSQRFRAIFIFINIISLCA